jgi:hypothetical protein
VEEREIVIEPFHGGWLAHYRGDRSFRVTAETPEEARRLLVAEEEEAVYSHRRMSVSGIAVLVVVLAAVALMAWKVTAQNAQAQHLVMWAHHNQHHKAHR